MAEFLETRPISLVIALFASSLLKVNYYWPRKLTLGCDLPQFHIPIVHLVDQLTFSILQCQSKYKSPTFRINDLVVYQILIFDSEAGSLLFCHLEKKNW